MLQPFGSANTAFSKAAHIANASSPICVTLAGIVTSDSSRQAKKAFSPIEVTPEPIERLSSRSHREKAELPISVTLSGMTMLCRLPQFSKVS